ncbi:MULTISPECIES: CbtA family protein [Bradyrhizobium]|jgi:cobalt transporter subunit CbtA|uniref:CbtA family protein n=1 Tax=Bradyrhizobium TaxID=374 RepID=UPI00048623B6|nr:MULTISPECIES: CbtA family protein [Bradyrhizobium]MCS3448252.1 cobalt transporter subunit CbtA [Bradyrhizobium elkanii]MCS3560609.1 cobalt transporter subunit CbtA [Bradyrhizobium elkanii]MCW2149548.1 cobalt transporter subunit CbtA [Bradyrhizobium elkanii]MCW2360484.1 cobalt transporter subunit CbtA [Bradyrhizobium elkanii]MCW2373277.1 cobalt transporter subunit CbtA [Bradyrhizobium elkanii]
MSTFRSIVFSSVIAGFIVGLIVTAVQQFGTVPLILRAEVYEKAAAHKHEASATPQAILVHDHADHDHGAEAWEPRDGLERNVYTAGANILTAIGFALLLCGFLAVRSGATGEPISWHEGLMWGLAGFAVFTIAPGLGLPPELPGVPTAPLLSRQIWWVTAVLATAAGLGLIVFRRSMPAAIAGVVLIMLPHLIGAPELEHVETNVPSSLSHQFVVAVTLTSLVFWSLLGSLTSAAFAYFDRPGSSAHG